MIETVSRKRIEILVDTPLVPRLIKHARDVDISGWSLIHVDAGGGRDGAWQHDDVTGAAAKTIILMIASEAILNLSLVVTPSTLDLSESVS